MARSYYMMQQLQQQYAFCEPKVIEYADHTGKFLTPSEAIATGALANGHLHVVYENGTEVWVNRSPAGTWIVKNSSGKLVELPVSGWLVINGRNGFFEESANIGGRRVDYVQAPEFDFLDGRGQWTEQGGLAATGSVALRHKADGTWELIDIYGNDRIAFRAPTAAALMAYDAEGKSLGKVEFTSPKPGWYQFKPIPEGRRYVCATAP
jgi:hypothetical protein